MYAYAQGVTSPRRIEQRIHEDLGFRASRSDPESRYLRWRDGFVLGYTAEVAVRTIT